MRSEVPIRQTTAWLWAGAVVLIVAAYGPGLDHPGRALREVILPPCALTLLCVGINRPHLRPSPWLPTLLGVAMLSGALGVLISPGAERLAVLRDAIVLGAPWVLCLAAVVVLHAKVAIDDAIERASVVALAGIAGVGLMQAWTGWQGVAQAGPPAAIFVNRNVAAQVVVLLLPLVAVVLVRPGRSAWRWAALAAETGGLTFLIATRARGAWLAVACGAALAAVVLFRLGGRARRERSSTTNPEPVVWSRLGIAVLLAALAALIPVQTASGSMPTVRSTLGTLAEPTVGSGGVRLALWSNTMAMTGSRAWSGHGAGRFSVVYPRFQAARRATPGFGTEYQPLHAHNDWLEYAAELGWPAASALAVAMLVALLLCLRPRDGTTGEQVLRRASRAGVIGGVLVHSLLSFPLHAPVGAFLAWTVVGRAWADAGGADRVRARARIPVAAALSLVAVVLLVLGAAEVRTRAVLGRAIHSFAAGDCGSALEESDRVARSAEGLRNARGMAAMIVFQCEPDAETSLPVLEQALAVHPNHLSLLLAVAGRQMNAGRLEEAEQAYRVAAEVVPDQARPWAGLAMVQAKRGDRAAAAASCRRALELEPDFSPARAFCEANELVQGAP